MFVAAPSRRRPVTPIRAADKQPDNPVGGMLVKNALTLLVAGLMALGLAVGCKNETPKTAEKPAQPAAAANNPAAANAKTGKVVETMNSGGYTYVQVDTGSEKFWAAAPQFQVKVGDPVVVPAGLAMPNYHSKTLNRDFDNLYFVDHIVVGGAESLQQAAGSTTPNDRTQVKETNVDFSGLKKVEGGSTVADIFTNKKTLAGKEVKIRAKVVKFSPQIMGKNWIHIEDGTGSKGTNDLTVTTTATAKVGDTVLVTGKVTADKDFGFGYKYDLILEDAQVKVE